MATLPERTGDQYFYWAPFAEPKRLVFSLQPARLLSQRAANDGSYEQGADACQ